MLVADAFLPDKQLPVGEFSIPLDGLRVHASLFLLPKRLHFVIAYLQDAVRHGLEARNNV